MEFSTIGAEDSLDEAKKRLNDVEILVVWGQENMRVQAYKRIHTVQVM